MTSTHNQGVSHVEAINRLHLRILQLQPLPLRQQEVIVLPYGIGLGLAGGVALLARIAGLDRDRAFYPTVLIVIAAIYVLFAATSESIAALLSEMPGMLVFTAIALVGFRGNASWVAIGLAAHGVFDGVHGYLVTNPGVPIWWSAFCFSYDVMAGLCLAYLNRATARASRSRTESGGLSVESPARCR